VSGGSAHVRGQSAQDGTSPRSPCSLAADLCFDMHLPRLFPYLADPKTMFDDGRHSGGATAEFNATLQARLSHPRRASGPVSPPGRWPGFDRAGLGRGVLSRRASDHGWLVLNVGKARPRCVVGALTAPFVFDEVVSTVLTSQGADGHDDQCVCRRGVVDAADTAITDPVASARAIRPLLSHHPRGQTTSPDDWPRRQSQALRECGPAPHPGSEAAFGGLECDLTHGVGTPNHRGHQGETPSAGWVTMILSTADWLVGLFPDQAQRDVLPDGPRTLRSARSSRRGGRPRAVGRRMAGWTGVGRRRLGVITCEWRSWECCWPIPPGEPARPVLALVPIAELGIEDTWRTLGMRAHRQ